MNTKILFNNIIGVFIRTKTVQTVNEKVNIYTGLQIIKRFETT